MVQIQIFLRFFKKLLGCEIFSLFVFVGPPCILLNYFIGDVSRSSFYTMFFHELRYLKANQGIGGKMREVGRRLSVGLTSESLLQDRAEIT